MSKTRFEEAIAAFDRANAEDPSTVLVAGQERPRELVAAERLSRWVERLAPDAPETLRLAARCQHLRRWEIPRSTYAEGRIGYLEWRKALGRFHADRAAEILQRAGYGDDVVERVRSINQKKSPSRDPDVQTMEDALCLSFLEFELDEFSAKHPADKVVDILRKTWRKMSDRGRARALELPLSDRARAFVGQALKPPP